jgi:hypothetical protein
MLHILTIPGFVARGNRYSEKETGQMGYRKNEKRRAFSAYTSSVNAN